MAARGPFQLWSLLLLAFLGAFVSGCGRRDLAEQAPPPAAPAPPLQRTAAAEPRPERKGWIGVVVTRESVDVTAETQGRLQAIYVEIGDVVPRGGRIATLDAQVIGQDLEMARSALRAAEADARRAAAELAEARQRSERRQANPEFFSKEDLAESELRAKTAASSYEVAQAGVAEQRSRIRQIEATRGQTEIRAPFDGRVAERFVDPGAVVGPGTPLVRLISSGDLLVRAAVPPEEARALAVGAPVTATARSTGLRVLGQVQRIAPEVDAASQMVLIEVRLTPGTGGNRLQTGQVVDVAPAQTPA